MWYSFYLDGWVSVYIPETLPLETYAQLSNVSRIIRSETIEYKARGPPAVLVAVV